MTDFWVGDLNVNISGIIKEEVKKNYQGKRYSSGNDALVLIIN